LQRCIDAASVVVRLQDKPAFGLQSIDRRRDTTQYY